MVLLSRWKWKGSLEVKIVAAHRFVASTGLQVFKKAFEKFRWKQNKHTKLYLFEVEDHNELVRFLLG